MRASLAGGGDGDARAREQVLITTDGPRRSLGDAGHYERYKMNSGLTQLLHPSYRHSHTLD